MCVTRLALSFRFCICDYRRLISGVRALSRQPPLTSVRHARDLAICVPLGLTPIPVESCVCGPSRCCHRIVRDKLSCATELDHRVYRPCVVKLSCARVPPRPPPLRRPSVGYRYHCGSSPAIRPRVVSYQLLFLFLSGRYLIYLVIKLSSSFKCPPTPCVMFFFLL